jgi:lipopolysaccharide transport system ATP-binding protein
VFLNGAILGMSRAETQSKFDGIVAFAEIEKFIDTPVKHYSSGMYVRLAFAVAAHLDPDVMIIDEVLAVGDAAFQRKCLARIGEVGSSGKTVLFVSHNLSSVQHLCTRGIVLEAGSVVFDGLVQEAVTHYLQSVSANGAATGSHVVDLRSAGPHKTRIKPVLKELVLFHGNGLPLDGSLPMGGSLRAHLVFDLDATGHKYDACVAFDNLMGQRVFTAHTLFEPSRSWQGGQGQKGLVCEIPSLPLLPGEYKVKVGVNIDGEEIDFIEDVTRIQVSSCDYYGTGVLPWNGEFVAPHHWRPLPNPQITPI